MLVKYVTISLRNWKRIKSDHKGFMMISTLFLLLLMLLIAATGFTAVVLQKRIKSAEHRNICSFYRLEQVVDQLEMGMNRSAAAAWKTAYQETLARLYRETELRGDRVVLDRNDIANQWMEDRIAQLLLAEGCWKEDIYEYYLPQERDNIEVECGRASMESTYTDTGEQVKSICFRDCMIAYREKEENSETFVTADFCIMLPKISFFAENSSETEEEKADICELPVKRVNWRRGSRRRENRETDKE